MNPMCRIFLLKFFWHRNVNEPPNVGQTFRSEIHVITSSNVVEKIIKNLWITNNRMVREFRWRVNNRWLWLVCHSLELLTSFLLLWSSPILPDNQTRLIVRNSLALTSRFIKLVYQSYWFINPTDLSVLLYLFRFVHQLDALSKRSRNLPERLVVF